MVPECPKGYSRTFSNLFFTTKEFGEGSGLGMSMVYGFATQSGGFIDIKSELDTGTTIGIYLPRSNANGRAAELNPTSGANVASGRETILVVEDQAAVRRIGKALLKSLGYQIFEADDGAAALALIRSNDDIDLLFTDVVMPGGISGTELAVQARQLRPDMKVLFTSGFNDTIILNTDALKSTDLMINKPYSKKSLARMVREALDQVS